MRQEMTAEQVKEEIETFSKNCPKLYAEYVEKDRILEPGRQIELARMNDRQFLDYVMNRNTSGHLGIFPEYASNVMKTFADEIFEELRGLKEVRLENLPELREQLGDKAKMIELSDWGTLYTQEPREDGAVMPTGELEFKVARAIPVVGPHFFTTTTGGFLKFYEEEIGRIAPDEANASLLGKGMCVTVSDGRASSPIIAGDYRNVGLKDDIYHVLPLKFFNVDIDRSKKYTTKTDVTERDAEGNASYLITKVVPRD